MSRARSDSPAVSASSAACNRRSSGPGTVSGGADATYKDKAGNSVGVARVATLIKQQRAAKGEN
ncbi:hypothetical protein ABZ504_55685, partial [Streptomyces mirabilis]|uniref:hypothetical protein n=1 Tax=Streptomyces mirabilis TaxID=68239 RepID=UPI0033EACFFC